jgi:MFS family permease
MSKVSLAADRGIPAAHRSAQPSLTREEFRVIGASCVGTVFEWYDFTLFGAIAPIVGRQFFANVDETTGLIFALLAFSAAFIVRPFVRLPKLLAEAAS